MANVMSLSQLLRLQALTRSVTSTSSESDNDFLETYRAHTLLAELEDDEEELPDPDTDHQNEDDDDLDDVMEDEELEPRDRRSWDDEFILKRQFSALIPAFDPRPGRTNVNQTSDLDIPLPGGDIAGAEAVIPGSSSSSSQAETDLVPQPKLHLTLRGPCMPNIPDVEIELHDADWTIFKALQKLVQASTMGNRQEKLKRIWEPTYTVVYRELKEEAVAVTQCNNDNIRRLMEDELFLPDFDMNTTNPAVGSCSVGDVLLLLRQLYVLSNRPMACLETEEPPKEPTIYIALEEFSCKKVTNKLTQQLSDPLVVSAGALPAWCEQLLTVCPMLVPFETRQMYFHATAFGISRSIVWLQGQRDSTVERQRNTGAVPRRDDPHEFRVGRLKHERVRVPRGERLLDWAQQVMKIHSDRKAILEVEFLDEEGTGLGPSLEFYALVAAEIQRRDLALWICDDDDLTAEAPTVEGAKPPGYYVLRPSGLFPAPLPQDSPICDHAEQLFWFLGVFLAKALQDGRLVDLPLSTPFLKLLCQ